MTQAFAVANAGGASPQSITFTSTAPANAIVGGAGYLAAATANSGLPVLLTIDGTSVNVCSIDNGIVSFIGPGACTIDANQGGDASYAPAPQVQQSFLVVSVGTDVQSITFTSSAPGNVVVGGPTYLATATATSGLPVVLTIDGGSATVCTINDGTVSFIGPGTCTIDANQGGDLTYAPAPQMQQAFAVASAGGLTSQAITFTSTAPAAAVVGGPGYLATASASSGLPVVLTIDDASATVCTIANATVSFIGPGTCTIDANQGGDGTYAPAPQQQQSFAVAAAAGLTSQTIMFVSTAPSDAVVGGPPYLATATASSGLPVVLTIDGASAAVCTINNAIVSFIGVGTCTIDADQGGDAIYAPAPQMPQSFAVAPAPLDLIFRDGFDP
jgi:Ethanolamine utilization protein EutJ (predicted chaperonin)